MKKKYTIDVVDIELFKGKPRYIVCVYRWFLFGLISRCVKTYINSDLYEATEYAKHYVEENGKYKNK